MSESPKRNAPLESPLAQPFEFTNVQTDGAPPASHPAETTPSSDAPPVVGQSGTIAQATPSMAALACAPFHLLVPGYEVLSELGRGGMGAVFKGHDLELNRDLAIKVLLESQQSDERTMRRFLEEAQIGGQLQHPGVVPVYEVGRLPDNRPYFTMKLVEGRTLAALLHDRKSPADDLPRFLKIFEQMCQTLAYAHVRGVIHRDLKPLNVMVGAFGEVQVMDWGLAKVVKGRQVRTVRSEGTDSETTTGSILGTPAYMAPEQACGDVDGLDERCDVFGLGAMLCEILTGEPPYRSRQTGELLRQAARGNTADAYGRLDACGADAELIKLAKSCLAVEPADRPANGGAVAEATTGYLAGVQERLRTAEMERAAAQARAKEERKRRRLTVALAMTMLLAALGTGAGALWYQQDRAARAAEQANQAAVYARRVADTERDVTAALDEASTLGAQARKLTDDPAKRQAALGEALSAVKRAEGVLNSGEGADELRGRVQAARHDLEAADKDRRMIALLDEAQVQQAEAGKDVFDTQGSAALYAAAFEQDMGLASLSPQQAAEQINRRAIREELVAALADWYNITSNKTERRRLAQLLQSADPDPASFRNRVNALAAKNNRDGLARLALSPEAGNQPTVQQVALARLLRPSEAVKFLRAANERRPSDFWITFQLAYSFKTLTPIAAIDEAVRYYTAAVALRPGSVGARISLGHVLREKGRLDEALGEYHRALELKPDYALTHNNLGNVLRDKGRLDDALAEYREAIRLKPDYVAAHLDLGRLYQEMHRLDEAITEYREVVRLKPEYLDAHVDLGVVLTEKGRLNDAVAQFQQAIELKPSSPSLRAHLGFALRKQGRFSESLGAFRRAYELTTKGAGGRNPYVEQVWTAQFLLHLDALLPALLQKEIEPSFPDVGVQFANVCYFTGRFDDAERLFVQSFAADPSLTANPANANRYTAACAALDACGTEAGGKTKDEKDRAALRKQALDWLRADLKLWTKKVSASPRERGGVRVMLQHWLDDADLAGVRDQAALSKLPTDEQAGWRKLWSEVDDLLKKTAPPQAGPQVPSYQ